MIANKIMPPPKSPMGWVARALLEIVIIVLGILLSLWISNSYQNSQDKQRAQSYLRRLDSNLMEDEAKLSLELAQRAGQLRHTQEMLQVIDPPWSQEGLGTLVEGFQSLLWTTRFSSSNATFRSLESSGELRLIEPDSLVNQIVSLYHNQYEGLSQNNEDVTKYRDNFLLPYTVKNISFRQSFNPSGTKVEFTPAQLDELYNHLTYEAITLQSTVDSYQATLIRVQQVRRSLQEAMK